MFASENAAFDAKAFLSSAGLGRAIVEVNEKQSIFSQGVTADSVFYLQAGCAKLTVLSMNGREATITLLVAGDFMGEEALTTAGAQYSASSLAITDCTALKIEREQMLRTLREERTLSEVFMTFLLARSVRTQSDLVDQLFNSSEKRLARILVLMADFEGQGKSKSPIPEISEQSLAEMIGTPQAIVSLCMNRFRERGLIDYDGRIRVHKSLLDAILRDRLPGDNTETPEFAGR